MAAEIRAERAAAGYTQEELSKFSGVSLSTLKRILNGAIDINVADLSAIADALSTGLPERVTPAELMERAVKRAGGYDMLLMSDDGVTNVIELKAKRPAKMTAAELDNYKGSRAAHPIDDDVDHPESD